MSNLLSIGGAGNPAGTGFYKHLLDQSLKFNDADSPYLHRTPASAGNRDIFTLSFWVKRTTIGAAQILFESRIDGDNRLDIRFTGDDTVLIYFEISNSNKVYKETTQLFRDVSAFYNIVLVTDTSDGTQADRVKLYVNGTQVSSFSTNTNSLSQNEDVPISSTNIHSIGANTTGGAPLDGYLAEINFIDGTALTPASFGETKDGIWIPKDTSGLTFGTNGFHLTFKDDVISEGFNTVTYRGTGAAQSVSGIGFEPSLIWVKRRDSASYGNKLYDAVRGFSQEFTVDATDGEYNLSGRVTGHSDGFDLGTYAGVNESGGSLVAWCWEGGGTPTATNSAGAGATPTAGSVKIDGSNLGSALAGTIPATKISANTARGFSIVGYEATGSAGTIAHGLSAAPELIICKHRDQSGTSWPVYYGDNTDAMYLNDSGATADDANAWNDTSPTSTVFSVGANGGDTNNSAGGSTVSYCFHSVAGYSKIGTFTGNGGSQAIDVGFEPAFVMLRRTSGSTWGIFDNLRGNSGSDRNLQMLAANSTAVETTNSQMTFSGNTFNDNGYLSDNGTTVLYMAFADTREAAFFKDVTTNGNHFVPVNLDYRNSVPDTPTNNFATFNALVTTHDLSEGNLRVDCDNSTAAIPSTLLAASGKWYAEILINDLAGSNSYVRIGVVTADGMGKDLGGVAGTFAFLGDGRTYKEGTAASYGSAVAAGNIFQIALDNDNGKLWFGINNTWMASGDPAAGNNPSLTFTAGEQMGFAVSSGSGGHSPDFTANFGQDSSFAGNHATANSNADGNGHGSFAYAPPSGYLALCSQNLPDVDIIDGTENFNTVLYTGNGSTQSITGVGFGSAPDFVWAKNRASSSYHHDLYDSVRGDNLRLNSSQTAAEATGFLTFDADGFSLTAGGGINASGNAHVAWNWKAGGTAVSNTAGSITSQVSANVDAGFSIVSYTGTGANATVGHGLGGVAPSMVIIKSRVATSGAGNWLVYAKAGSVDETDYLLLNSTAAADDAAGAFNDTAATTTTFSLGTFEDLNQSSITYIAYCFANVEGYSKVGSFVANGNADGPFVYTGFRPAWIMLKESGNARNWVISYDNETYYNGVTQSLFPNITQAEDANARLDFLSNGFKLRTTSTSWNNSGGTFIYLAFASQPFRFANAR